MAILFRPHCITDSDNQTRVTEYQQNTKNHLTFISILLYLNDEPGMSASEFT